MALFKCGCDCRGMNEALSMRIKGIVKVLGLTQPILGSTQFYDLVDMDAGILQKTNQKNRNAFADIERDIQIIVEHLGLEFVDKKAERVLKKKVKS